MLFILLWQSTGPGLLVQGPSGIFGLVSCNQEMLPRRCGDHERQAELGARGHRVGGEMAVEELTCI